MRALEERVCGSRVLLLISSWILLLWWLLLLLLLLLLLPLVSVSPIAKVRLLLLRMVVGVVEERCRVWL